MTHVLLLSRKQAEHSKLLLLFIADPVGTTTPAATTADPAKTAEAVPVTAAVTQGMNDASKGASVQVRDNYR